MPYVRRRTDPNPEPDPNAEVSVGSSSPPHTSLAVEIPIYLLVVFTPVAIGTVHLWSIAVMLGLAIVSFGSLALRHARRHHGGLKLFPIGLVLMIAAALTLLQILPLPPFFVRILNPGAGDLFDHVLIGTPLWGHGNWSALSLDPPASAVELLKVLSYLMAFLVVVNYYNERARARRLLKAVAWTGFGVALIGFFSKLFNAEGLLGFYPTPSGTEAFKKELAPYKGGKGSIKFPLDQPIPYGLMEKIVKFRVKEQKGK